MGQRTGSQANVEARASHGQKEDKSDHKETANLLDPEDDVKKSQTYFEFFDEEMLKDFLNNREKPYDGILQKFIEPDST